MNIDGINAHIPNQTWIKRAKTLGISWIRIDVNWCDIERKQGSYSFSAIDTAVNTSKSMGLKVYASIAYTPEWISSDRRSTPPQEQWVKFVSTVARRYGSKIDIYGLWNEPNLKAYYKGTMKEYRNIILTPGYNAIKTVNPNLQVAGGEIATVSGSDWPSWCDMLYKEVAHLDILAIHTYQDDADAVENRFNMGKAWIFGWLIPFYRPYNMYLDKFRKKGKKIFLTEVGWEASKDSQKQQKKRKDNIEKLMKNKKKIKVDEIFIYDLHDEPAFLDHPWGLFNPDGSPKFSE